MQGNYIKEGKSEQRGLIFLAEDKKATKFIDKLYWFTTLLEFFSLQDLLKTKYFFSAAKIFLQKTEML